MGSRQSHFLGIDLTVPRPRQERELMVVVYVNRECKGNFPVREIRQQ